MGLKDFSSIDNAYKEELLKSDQDGIESKKTILRFLSFLRWNQTKMGLKGSPFFSNSSTKKSLKSDQDGIERKKN